MKMKYCPECGSIQLQSNGNGMQCKKCSFLGEMKEDSIDVINSFIAAKRNANSVQSSPSSTLIMRQETKPNSLKERLKKFESDDIEIL